MKKLFLGLLGVVLLSSCQRGCQRFEKKLQTTARSYEVKMYSGGKVVFTDSFRGVVNENETSDGIYYYKQDSLIQISGDYTVKAVD